MKPSSSSIFACLVLSACGCSRASEPSKDAIAVPAAVAAPGAAVVSQNADAPLKVNRNGDGSVRVEFTDRWGVATDATYENLQYLERAVPTLSRAMSDDRAAELKQQLKLLATSEPR